MLTLPLLQLVLFSWAQKRSTNNKRASCQSKFWVVVFSVPLNSWKPKNQTQTALHIDSFLFTYSISRDFMFLIYLSTQSYWIKFAGFSDTVWKLQNIVGLYYIDIIFHMNQVISWLFCMICNKYFLQQKKSDLFQNVAGWDRK